MARVRRFKPALAGLVDPDLAVIHLRLDLTREDIGVDEGGFRMRMRRGSGARRIVDFHNDERLAGNVRDRLIEFARTGFGLHVMRYCRPGNSDGAANVRDGGTDLQRLLLVRDRNSTRLDSSHYHA